MLVAYLYDVDAFVRHARHPRRARPALGCTGVAADWSSTSTPSPTTCRPATTSRWYPTWPTAGWRAGELGEHFAMTLPFSSSTVMSLTSPVR
jgi:hypothetical protein